MNKEKSFLDVIFGSVKTSYLLKHYAFAFVLVVAILYSTFSQGFNNVINNFGLLIIVIISFVLYPFAMYVYNSLVQTILGDKTYFKEGALHFLLRILWIIVRGCIIFALTIFIAPLGMLYLWIKNRKK